LPAIVYERAVERVRSVLQREQLAIYVYEIKHVEKLLQRRMGLNFGMSDSHWLVLYDAIRDLVGQGVLVAYRDPIEECLAVVARSRWQKDVRAEPSMASLRVEEMPEREVVMSMVQQPKRNGEVEE